MFDDWLLRPGDTEAEYSALHPKKFRKMDIFFNPLLRTFERLIFFDADGIVESSLDPLVFAPFPENVSILMRQNDVSMGKNSLFENEIEVHNLTMSQQKQLHSTFPNRTKTGRSSWSIVDVDKLPSPTQLLSSSLEILCAFGSGFKFNDRTLMNLVFYNEMSLFPWCIADEVPVMEESEDLAVYCWEMDNRRIISREGIRFIYRHFGEDFKQQRQCLQLPLSVEGLAVDGDVKNTYEVNETGQDANWMSYNSPNFAFLYMDLGAVTCMEGFKRWRKRLTLEQRWPLLFEAVR